MMEKDSSGSVSEDDVSIILQRYSPTTILALLQEVAQVEDVKIDWNALVKRSKTGITNPREYQMLWRHLAYCDPLLEKLEANTEPLDDDSDLEYELEAFPTVSSEASAEAAACVKVLMSSGTASDSCIEKGLIIEAPLTINIPKANSTQHPSQNPPLLRSTSSGVNISVPVYVPTQLIPTISSAEGLDNANVFANNNYPPRRKRKPWSAEEDRELFTAVQRFGEGNWATMLKGDFRSDRTAAQLSQRWHIIKKRQNHPTIKTGSQPSETQLAARLPFSMALDKPGLDIPKSTAPFGWTNPGTISVQPTVTDSPSTPTGPKRPFPRPQQFLTRPLPSGSDGVKAFAVAAGARVVTKTAAEEMLKQQLKGGAIHIKTSRSPPAPVAHIGYPSISPRGPRPNIGPVHANPRVGPVEPLTHCSTLKPPSLVTSVEPVDEDQVAVSMDQQQDVAQDIKVRGSGFVDKEMQSPGSSDSANTNRES